MESLNRIIFGLLILHLYVNAAPSDVSKIEDTAKVTEGQQLDLGQALNENQDVEKATGSQREKRWYNPYGFGVPPVNPVLYPNRRQEPPGGVYGYEDPLEHIHRRVQEIAGIVRQPYSPPPVPNFPFFFPVLIVPSNDCVCNDPNTKRPTVPPPTYTPPGPIPNVTERWPEMEDERQNWGLIVNETESEEGEDFSRPISFDPIKPVRPGNRPPPPVEHGSVQSDAQNGMPANPPPQFAPSRPAPPASTTSNPLSSMAPSPCDAALLTCCHQPVVTYECFAVQGCPGFTSLGNPCTPNSILRVIEIYQRFYGQKSR